MATLAGNTIASTYPLLLKIDSSGIDGTLRAVEDGDGTDSALKISTSGISVGGTVTVGADDTGYDVIFYGDTASSNMTWDTSEDDLILNDSTLHINQDDDASSILIDSESTSANVLNMASAATTTGSIINLNACDALTTGKAIYVDSNSDDNSTRNLVEIINNHTSATGATALKIQQDAAQAGLFIDQNGNHNAISIDSENTTQYGIYIESDALTTGSAGYFYSDSSDTGTRSVVKITNDHASATGATGLHIKQDANQKSIVIDSASTTNHVMRIDGPLTTTGTCLLIDDVDAITTGTIASFLSNAADNSARNLVQITNDNTAATGAIGLKIQQDATTAAAIRADGGKIEFINTSLNTTASFYGLTNQITKTAGSTNASDDFWGMYNELEFNDSDDGFGHLRGIHNKVKVAAANATEATTILGIESQVIIDDGDVNNVFGHYNKVDVDAGQIDAEIYGTWNEIDLESGVGGVVNCFAGAFLLDADTNPSSRASVLWLDAYTNCDFSVQGYNRPGDTISWQVTFDGVQTNEGAINPSTGLDYAEYFESKDGKAIAIGKTVKLDGDKIVACEDGDTPIGVVRPVNTSGVIGGGQVFHWQEKFVKDDYGATVWESYTLKKWSEEITEEEYNKRNKDETGGVEGGKVTDTKVEGSEAILAKDAVTEQKTVDQEVEEEVTTTSLVDGKYVEKTETVTKTVKVPQYNEVDLHDKDGKVIGKHQVPIMETIEEAVEAVDAVPHTYFREHKYQSDKLPEGVTPPDDAKTITPGNKRQKVNSDYDPSKAKEYKSREEREEWHIIGLLGQIQITKGQPIAASWIKMKDISDTVEMYFVK